MYHQMTDFWSEEISEITNVRNLIPDVVKYRRTGCFATKELEIFDLLRR
jgi:hypothetical protein